MQRRAKARSHPDRDAQFEYINAGIKAFRATGQPAISVDTKKKELVEDFKNAGRELRPKGDPEPVGYDLAVISANWAGLLYGVIDIVANTGWINLGINHDTAAFALESIRRWWQEVGQARYQAGQAAS